MNAVKQNIRVFIPSIYEFLENQDFPWSTIDYNFNAILDSRIKEMKKGNNKFEVTIYDIILDAKKGDNQLRSLLFFFNRLFEELMESLDQNGRKTVKTTVRKLLSSFDQKFLNFIGELAVLNNLLKSGNVELISCEVSLDNGKSIDLDVKFIKQNMRALIEVYNIHLDSDKVENDHKKIEIFLKKRLLDKRKDKVINNSKFKDKIHLIPVLWGDTKSLRIYEGFFKSTEFKIPLTYEPMTYVSYTNGVDRYESIFDPITKVFRD